jgi:amino acid adenylation domain-containing protein
VTGWGIEASAEQNRLWIIDRHDGGGRAYVASVAWDLNGPLDAERLSRAVDLLVERHESLRCRFRMMRDGLRIGDIEPGDRPKLEVTHAAPAPNEVTEFAQQPFNLEAGPLFRARIWLFGDRGTLVLAMHHAIVDGWSIGIIAEELGLLYAEAGPTPHESTAGRLPPAPKLVDMASWQAARHTEYDETALKEFWTGMLDGVPHILELPVDRPRTARVAWDAGSQDSTLDAAVTTLISDLAAELRTSNFAVTLALTAAFLGRWCNQDDVVLGVPATLVRDKPVERAVGFLVNTVPLRLDLRGDPTVRDLVTQAAERAIEAIVHQDLPLQDILACAHTERTPGVHPLFQVMLAFQNIPRVPLVLGECIGTSWTVPAAEAKFDLLLDVTPTETVTAMRWEYRAGLFDAGTIADAAGRFARFCRRAGTRPDARLSELTLLEHDEAPVLYPPAVRQDHPSDTVLDRVWQRVKEFPDRCAVRCEAGVVTRAQLWRLATSLACALAGVGVAPGDRVGVHLRRGSGLLVAPLAIWMVGGVYVPLDPWQPARRLQNIAGRSDLAAVVVDDDAAPLDCPQVPLPDPQGADGGELAASDHPSGPGDPAYLMFTSGSTGSPKGVLVAHGSLLGFLDAFGEVVRLTAEDRFLAATTTTFDISLAELLMPLVHGCECVVATDELASDPVALADHLRRQDVSVVQATPSVWALLAPGLPSIRIALCGGEALPDGVRDLVRQVAPEAFNVYGPTEATIWSSVWRLDDGPVLVGRCLANNSFLIRDDWGDPAPAGTVGELWIGGPSLALGYWREPDLTEASFQDADGQRLYRTGDLAVRRRDGMFAVRGRIDDQLKVRGYRIEPREIEATLDRLPEIEASAIVAASTGLNRTLVAFVVANAPKVPETEHVDEWQQIWDETYQHDEGEFAGWVSSLTGQPYPAAVMRDWLAATLAHIGPVTGRAVLEIGAGTGSVTARLAPAAERWVATDVSPAALARLATRVRAPHLTTVQATADDLSMATGTFDLIILNSVIQYFPSETYLRGVLSAALGKLSPGGRLFVGDIRSLPFAGAFGRAIREQRQDHEPAIPSDHRDDSELLVDPRWLHSFAGEHGVRARFLVKSTRRWSEMTAFRYDVVIEHDDGSLPRQGESTTEPLDWRDIGSVRALSRLLGAGRSLAVGGIPNAANSRWLDESARGVELEELVELAEERDLVAEIGVDLAQPTRVVVTFSPRGTPPTALRPPAGDELGAGPLISEPRNRRLPSFDDSFNTTLRQVLPDYMIPNRFVAVPELPRMSNGKVDRRRLQAWASRNEAAAAGPAFEPVHEQDRVVVSAWREVLGSKSSVRLDDHFFRSGGDSLGGVRLLARMNSKLGTNLKLPDLVEHPRLKDLITIARGMDL